MSAVFELEALPRSDVGKGASRRLRKTDNIPAVLYGTGKPAVSLTLDHKRVLKALESEAFYSHLLTIRINGKAETAILKALQRHEYKPKILHMDFLRVNMNEKLTMRVPLHFINEELSPGVKNGGVVSHVMSDVEIECLPKDLPEYINVDLAQAELDHSIHLSHIQLPKGVELVALMHEHDETIATIHKPRAEEVVEEGSTEAADTAATEAPDTEENK